MPIFEYQCNKCGNRFEELFLSNIEKKVSCPKCGDEKIEKLPSLIGGISVKKSSNTASQCSKSCSNAQMCSSGRCGID
ncbi:MAG: zinc ribbon domain-containing protein [Chitinispirillaceae bacterium]|nr:zinc ribbon domain-containing protein [Chitinispirillaceae bacterium]